MLASLFTHYGYGIKRMYLIEKIKNVITEIEFLIFYKTGEGSVSSLLSDKLNSMIPSFRSPKSDLKVSGKWRYREDNHGIIIRIYGVAFKNINTIFESFLGNPPVSGENNIDGFPQVGYYGKNHRGYHLQFYQKKNFVEIVCVGKKSSHNQIA